MKKILSILPFLLTAAFSENVILSPIDVTGGEGDESTVTQKESYLSNAPSQKQITAKQAIQMAGSNGDPIKALQNMAGVVSTNNDNGSDIYIHGAKPRETSYSLNHLPLGYVFHFGGLHSVIATEATDQIDAYLGGFDTTYDAMGAVVDITPKYPRGDNSGHIHIGMYDADFAYDMKIGENTNLFIGARRSYFDLIADKILDELEKDDNDASKKTTFTLFPQFHDAQLILTHNYENHFFSLEVIHANDKMKLFTTMNKNADPVANGKINTHSTFTTVGARWNYEDEDVSSMTLLSYFDRELDLDLFNVNYYVQSTVHRVGLYHETVFHMEDHKPLVGLELDYTRSPLDAYITNPPSSNDFAPLITDQDVVNLKKTFKSSTYTFFAQDIWDITSRDHLRYGVRVGKTDFQAFDTWIDPRVAYVHDLSDKTSLSLSVGKYSQFPEFTYVVEGFGNPQIDTSEVAYHYTLNFKTEFDDSSVLEIEPYYKTFENLAIDDDTLKYLAVGEGRAYGLDITYRKNVEDLNLIFAYTYINAQRELNTNSTKQYRFEGDIPHTVQIQADYTFKNNWRVATRLAYSSGRPYTPIIGSEPYTFEGTSYVRPLYGDPYSKRMPATYDFDLQISKKYEYSNGTSMEYSLELMNINALFRDNIDSYDYNDQWERDGEIKQLGFLPALHMTYRF